MHAGIAQRQFLCFKNSVAIPSKHFLPVYEGVKIKIKAVWCQSWKTHTDLHEIMTEY